MAGTEASVSGPALWLALAAFGAIGALARFELDRAISARVRTAFPLGILAVNVSGAFALGLLFGLAPGSTSLVVLGTGFLGAYTTFSTWIVDSERLAAEGRWMLGFLNVLGSMAAGLIAAGMGLGVAAALS